MIERKFVNQNIKEFEIKEHIKNTLSRVGLSDVKLQRTPLGEKIVISTSRPGLVVGRSGTNITKLTKELKEVFKLENPQIEIEEVINVGLDANIIAEMIANSLERFGLARFKGIGHKAMADVMGAGALGVEILISGKVPSTRAKTWRFYQGYLKKCGDIAVSSVKVAYSVANLKTGAIGVKVSIMTPDTVLPDRIKVIKETTSAAVGTAAESANKTKIVEQAVESDVVEVKTDLDEKMNEMIEAKTTADGEGKNESGSSKKKKSKDKKESKESDQSKAVRKKKAEQQSESKVAVEDAEPADASEKNTEEQPEGGSSE